MCVTLAPARLTNTVVGMFETDLMTQGEIAHVMAYQNTPVNTSDQPNAMLLHIPAGAPLTPENIVDTRGFPHFMTDIVKALSDEEESTLSFSKSMGSKSLGRVYVFEQGIYTWVLAEHGRDIPGALQQVPQEKRPDLNEPLFGYYDRAFPGWWKLLGCFTNHDASKTGQPVLIHYTPKDEDFFHVPMLDCHTGDIPDIDASVARDTWVVFGSHRLKNPGTRVVYSDNLPTIAKRLLPQRIAGIHVAGIMQNGDMAVSISDALRLSALGLSLNRFLPPGLTAAS